MSHKLIEISKNGLRKYNERYFISTREIIRNPEWDTLTVGQDLIIDKKDILKIQSLNNVKSVTEGNNIKKEKLKCKLDIEKSSILNQGAYKITRNAIKIINV